MSEGDLSKVVITPEIKKTIAGRYHSGESAVELAKVYRIYRTTVNKYVSRYKENEAAAISAAQEFYTRHPECALQCLFL